MPTTSPSRLQAPERDDEDGQQLSQPMLTIMTALKQLDLPDLLLLQGLTEQMSRARIDRYAAGRVGSARAAEIHALFADIEERPERPATPVGDALTMPRSQPPFGSRDDLAALVTSAAMGAAIERGHADLNALLATDEFISLSEAAKRCGVSEQTVRTRVKAGKLFGVSGPGGSRSKYPVWQFSEAWTDGVLATLLAAMPAKSGLDLYRFFVTPSARLRGGAPASPLDYLGVPRSGAANKDGRALDDARVQSVLTLARAFAAEGAAEP